MVDSAAVRATARSRTPGWRPARVRRVAGAVACAALLGVLAVVVDRVRDGASLADAWAEATPSTAGFEHAILAAGEQVSTLEPMLLRLAETQPPVVQFGAAVALLMPATVGMGASLPILARALR